MTNDRLEELNNLKKQIDELEDALNGLLNGHYDYLEISGRYSGDPATDYIMDTDHVPGLRGTIINHVREVQAMLKKRFEEA